MSRSSSLKMMLTSAEALRFVVRLAWFQYGNNFCLFRFARYFPSLHHTREELRKPQFYKFTTVDIWVDSIEAWGFSGS